MDYVKQKLSEEIEKRLSDISNHCDGEDYVYLYNELNDLCGELNELKQKWATIQMLLNACVDEWHDTSDELFELCDEYGEDFSEMWKEFEKLFG